VTSFQQQTVLVVDDEPFSQGLVAQMLRRAGAGEVLLAANGYEALDILERHSVTAIIIDFRMPGIHGLELLKRIRTGRTPAARNLICVMLTGHAVRHLVGLAIVLDVDTFLAKPVSLETLVKHLSRSLQYRFEPLPVENYEAVDVRHADAFLRPGAAPSVSAPKEPEDAEAAEFLEGIKARAANAMLKPEAKAPTGDTKPVKPERTEAKAPAKPISKSAPKPAPPGRELPAAPAASGPSKSVKLSEIPEGAVIAKNIVGRSGTLLVAAGTPFRARYARRLQELSDIEGEIKDVWIYE
jgi:CheY-like chemotaxis protein